MRVRAEQTQQQTAFTIASMLGISQERYVSPINDSIKAVSQSGQGFETLNCFVVPVSYSQFGIIPHEMLFDYLDDQWSRESAVMSSTTEIVMLPSYQTIMCMGPDVVPLILRQLEKEGNHPNNWFWALRHITRENPVPSEHRGNRKAMAKDWLNWAHGRYVR